MDRNDLINSFRDTFAFSQTGKLGEETAKAASASKIYYESFEANVKTVEKTHGSVFVVPNTTFAEAQECVKYGRVAVLNFANPENPGGGVEFGAIAQEECLCRSSNLYACLISDHLYDDFYNYHRKMRSNFYSDRLIYTRDVTVFKSDDTIPVMINRKRWFKVDVITCAAPYMGQSKYTPPTVLSKIFKARIKNIMEAALDNNVDVIILGAFGCGAFKNSPKLVAKAFKEAIEEKDYCNKFKRIIFAIKKESEKEYGINYDTFYSLLQFPRLIENCPSYSLPEIILPTGKVIEETVAMFSYLMEEVPLEEAMDYISQGDGFSPETNPKVADSFKKQQEYLKWQRNNPYYQKKISILGDSISTLEGYNPEGYNVFFTGDKCDKAKVHDMKDTWWGQVINNLGAELLVNNSWSGSRVTRLPNSEKLFPSGCSDERTYGLHINDTLPDVIIVYLGTNDWAYGVSTQPERMGGFDEKTKTYFDGYKAPDEYVFSYAYELMLKKLKNNYPDAEICCCTLNSTFMSERPQFIFPFSPGGVHIDVYNNIITNAVSRCGCKLIDLAGYSKAYDSIDGSHPNSEGMKTLATMVLRELECGISTILDCENGEHNYILAERYTGGSKYVCSVCCNVKHEAFCMQKKIVKAHISYSGRSIALDGDILTWRDTMDPNSPPIPDYDYSEKKKNLSANDIRLLVSELEKVCLDGCVSDSETEIFPGARYSIYNCRYDDGSSFVYSTRSEPAPAFKQLKEILNKRCYLGNNGFAIPNSIKLAVPQTEERDYIQLDPDVTDVMFPDKLKLLMVSTNKTVTIQKEVIRVGKDIECDLNFGMDNAYISRFHATFTFKMGKWYLTDDNSFNGTFINGVKLQPGKKYQLAADDEIVFAQYSKVIFYKTPWAIKPPVFPINDILRVPTVPKDTQPVINNVGPIMLGKVIGGKYKLEKLLKAGHRPVYLATAEGEGKKYAVKVEPTSKFGNLTEINHIKESFELHKQIDLPNVAKAVELIETPRYLYFVTEYLEGETLDILLGKTGQMDPQRAAKIAKNIAVILKALHSLNPPVIHRDIKPSNIIITNDCDVKLFDFGIANRFYNCGSVDEQIVGTVGYAPTEQYLGFSRPQSDIYALGITMYYMLTHDDPKSQEFTYRSPSLLNPKVPKKLERIVEKCVRKDWTERYSDCKELINDLTSFIKAERPGLLVRLFGKK